MDIIKRPEDISIVFWFGITTIVFPSLMMGLILFIMEFKNRQIINLIENGIPGTAILEDLTTTGLEINDVPQYKLFLRVRIPTRQEYKLQYKTCINFLSLSEIQKGMELTVYTDPENHEKIYVQLPGK